MVVYIWRIGLFTPCLKLQYDCIVITYDFGTASAIKNREFQTGIRPYALLYQLVLYKRRNPLSDHGRDCGGFFNGVNYHEKEGRKVL